MSRAHAAPRPPGRTLSPSSPSAQGRPDASRTLPGHIQADLVTSESLGPLQCIDLRRLYAARIQVHLATMIRARLPTPTRLKTSFGSLSCVRAYSKCSAFCH